MFAIHCYLVYLSLCAIVSVLGSLLFAKETNDSGVGQTTIQDEFSTMVLENHLIMLISGIFPFLDQCSQNVLSNSLWFNKNLFYMFGFLFSRFMALVIIHSSGVSTS